MKRLYPLLTLVYLFFCLDSCQKEEGFVLEGEMKELASDMLLAIYDDPESKTDTIYLQNGKFIYKVNPDTFSIFRLVNDSGETIPIFANKRWHVTLKGDFHSYTIEGEGPNKEFQEFLSQTAGATDKRQKAQMAEEFVKSHPKSFVSAYLINRYFVQVENPDEDKIKSLIQPLDGNIKDCRVLSTVLRSLKEENDKKRNNTEYLNYFSAKARDGKYVSWNNAKHKYTLVNFWATWNSESVEQRDSLFELVKEFKGKGVRVLNFSLDYDKKAWERFCKKDSEQWIEICDTKAWDNQIIKQMNFLQIPSNVLINGSRRIEGTNLYGDNLRRKLKELTDKEKK